MKKIYSVLLAATALTATCCLCACSSEDKDSPETPPPPGTLDNAFSYGTEIRRIASAIYTTEEQEGCTTFYFSPTADIADPEGMKLAGDCLKITVPDPSGRIDLTAAGVEVLCGDIALTPSTLEGYPKASLSVRLTSAQTVSLELDVEAQSGQTLKSDYYGICRPWPVDESVQYDYPCTDCIQASYFGRGEGGKDVTNYYLIFTTQPYEIITDGFKQYIKLVKPGYVLYLDTYAPLVDAENKLSLTPGSYLPDLNRAPFTYYSEYSAAIWQDEAGGARQHPLAGPIEIGINEEGSYTLATSFLDESGAPVTIGWEGPLTVTDDEQSQMTGLPNIGEDVQIVGTSAKAVYYGNLFASSTGFLNILIYDDKYLNEEGAGGLCASVAVFNKLFTNPKFAAPIPGTYEVATDFRNGSWMPGVEMNYIGMLVPMGCYIQQDDGSSYGRFAMGLTGTVTIADAGQGAYKVDFEMTSRDGYKMKGSYTGEIPVTDESDDDGNDDGTSTLEEDHDMDLSQIKTARLWPLEDKKSDEAGMCGWQDIDIGSASGWDFDQVIVNRDIFRAELYVPQGTSGMLTPGTYPVVEENWPAYIKPGMAAKGRFTTEADWSGTRWMHFRPDHQYLYMDGHAFGYGGEVKVEKAEGGDNWFTFSIDVTCVRGMHVRGTWTGPVINGFTNEPVLSTETDVTPTAAAVRKHAAIPGPAEVRKAAAQLPGALRDNPKQRF